jgi:4-carboxymuconolactone decarboxylase
MARVPQITSRDDMPEEHRHVADQVWDVFGRIRGPFSILLHSPGLAERLLPMVPFARDETVVEGPLRAVGILAAVREKDSAYVWSAQVGAARRYGLREAAIDLLRAKADPSAFEPDERDVVIYARQLTRDSKVDQAAFDTLHNRYGTQWLTELTALMAFYCALTAVTNAFEVGTPEGGDRF